MDGRTIQEKLREYYGYQTFRPGQAEIIHEVLHGRDVLGVMPTGGGKSICYQLPSLLLNGVVIVVSPLIALMKDQVDSLNMRDFKVTFINSTLTLEEMRERSAGIRNGRYNLVFIAPERIQSGYFVELLQGVKVALLAVDEAHCVSQWGHDFRTSYLGLKDFRLKLGVPPVVALTATATPEVREDIITHLGLKDPVQMIRGFARSNLFLQVIKCYSETNKFEVLEEILAEALFPGIIYVGTRKKAEELLSYLKKRKLRVGMYHGGIDDTQRAKAQDAFMNGKIDLVIATKAFGMGVDKADVRIVIHYEMPGSLEEYYQEAGRAGRDGLPSRCILLYCEKDRELQKFFIRGSFPSRSIIENVYKLLCKNAENLVCTLTPRQLALILPEKTSDFEVQSALRELKKAGCINEIIGSKEYLVEILSIDKPEIDYDYLNTLKAGKYDKLHLMENYAQTEKCLHRFILDYFGDESEMEACPGCGNCVTNDEITEKLALTDTLSEEQQQVVQKVLSCVYRLKGRYGISVVAQVLTGSKSKKILEWNLAKLSTYNIIDNYSQDEVKRIVEAALKIGYLKQSNDQYPTISITDNGIQVANHPEQIKIRWPLTSKATATVASDIYSRDKVNTVKKEHLDYDETLFESLRNLRMQIAREEKVAPFVIFHDRTLKEMAALKPRNREQMLQIWGVAERSFDRRGRRFLEHIMQFLD